MDLYWTFKNEWIFHSEAEQERWMIHAYLIGKWGLTKYILKSNEKALYLQHVFTDTSWKLGNKD